MTEADPVGGITPSQTVGPFFSIGLHWDDGPFAVRPDEPGGIWVRGRVFDGAGDPVPDAVVETWQTSPETGPLFRGFARSSTDVEGRYAIRTLKPGPVPGPDGSVQAPHLAVSVFARGLLDRVVTRIYFADEAEANAVDPVLGSVVTGAGTLVAEAGPDGYLFDVRLQGDDETVFFNI